MDHSRLTKLWETSDSSLVPLLGLRSGSVQFMAAGRRFRIWVNDAGKNWAASWVRTFSPTTVLQAQYGRVHVARTTTFQRFS